MRTSVCLQLNRHVLRSILHMCVCVLMCACVGGPLGELVQWSDIISTLYVLGHDLTIISEVEELTRYSM